MVGPSSEKSETVEALGEEASLIRSNVDNSSKLVSMADKIILYG